MAHHSRLTREKLNLSDLENFGKTADSPGNNDFGIAKRQVGERKNELARLLHEARNFLRTL